VEPFGVEVHGVALQPDGKIVFAGYGPGGGGLQAIVARYASGGTLDASYGTNGFASLPSIGGIVTANPLPLDPDGRAVIVGDEDGLFGVARLQGDGGLTAIGEGSHRDEGLRMSAPMPNPTRGAVEAAFELGHAARVSALVLDVAGRRVRQLLSDE